MSEQLPPFFYSLALKTPPDISDNQAAVHSLVLQIAIWQTFHSQRYILPTTSIHHDSNKRLLNPKQPKEPIAMRYSNTICDRINKKNYGEQTGVRQPNRQTNQAVTCRVAHPFSSAWMSPGPATSFWPFTDPKWTPFFIDEIFSCSCECWYAHHYTT